MRYINLIGVEIEGGWSEKPAILKTDGSVHISKDFAQYAGECISPPGSLDQINDWIDKYKPDYVNSTCGLHVHFSMKKMSDYVRLMEDSFYSHFYTSMDSWGKAMQFGEKHQFWSRLGGSNTYCKKGFNLDNTERQTYGGGDRYTHLNYCFSKHGTIECRLFPAFKDPEKIKKAVKVLVRTVNTYLDSNEDKTRQIFEELIPLVEA